MESSFLIMDEYEYVTDILKARESHASQEEVDTIEKVLVKLESQPLSGSVLSKTLFTCSVCSMAASEVFKTCPSCGVVSSKIKTAVLALDRHK